MGETIKGFRTNEGIAQIDYDALANKPTLVNPNLLDNWYFGNPVNQRRTVSYINGEYGIDRWLGVGVDVISGGLKFNEVGSWLLQKIEATLKSDLNGKPVTASAVYDDNKIIYGSLIYATGSQLYFAANDDFQLVLQAEGELLLWSAKASVNVKAIKLELGDVQTLAHQDANGNWVLNEIPNYADQLARCQRYQYVLNAEKSTVYQFTTDTQAYSTSRLYAFVPLPVPMRTDPSVTFDGVAQAENGGVYHEITAYSVFRNQTTGVTLSLTTSGLTKGATYVVRSINKVENGTPATIILNANL